MQVAHQGQFQVPFYAWHVLPQCLDVEELVDRLQSQSTSYELPHALDLQWKTQHNGDLGGAAGGVPTIRSRLRHDDRNFAVSATTI